MTEDRHAGRRNHAALRNPFDVPPPRHSAGPAPDHTLAARLADAQSLVERVNARVEAAVGGSVPPSVELYRREQPDPPVPDGARWRAAQWLVDRLPTMVDLGPRPRTFTRDERITLVAGVLPERMVAAFMVDVGTGKLEED